MTERVWILALAGLLAVTLGTAALTAAETDPSGKVPTEAVSAAEIDGSFGVGRGLYQRYCRSCHGTSAKGDGSVAKFLKVAPADLTRLRVSNDGLFPTERVLESIDGREVSVPLHGRDMPIWGAVFQVEDGQTEDDVQRKLADLLAYLRGVQSTETAATEDE